MSARAVVFAYHDVGVRCLKVLLDAGLDVALVVTHEDDAAESRWFDSVADAARAHGLEVQSPTDPNAPATVAEIEALQPDFVFSFYYRALLGARLLGCARLGALNMHGSLLPRYRGRAPVNWAIVNGEQETGVTLHYMTERADAGDIVDQQAVPILQDDDARAVLAKVARTAEVVLARSLPRLLNGSAPRTPQRLQDGGYFGRRRPEDGRIDWRRSALQIHNLVRGVAPPFPGAFTEVGGQRLWIYRTRLIQRAAPADGHARLVGENGQCYLECRDGAVLQLLEAASANGPLDLAHLSQTAGEHPVILR